MTISTIESKREARVSDPVSYIRGKLQQIRGAREALPLIGVRSSLSYAAHGRCDETDRDTIVRHTETGLHFQFRSGTVIELATPVRGRRAWLRIIHGRNGRCNREAWALVEHYHAAARARLADGTVFKFTTRRRGVAR